MPLFRRIADRGDQGRARRRRLRRAVRRLPDYKPLFPRLHRSFGYELLEPIRRDFDTTLARFGHDLDRVEAEAGGPGDYTLPERARDLAGAVRWNIQPPLARLVSRRRLDPDPAPTS